MVVPPPLLRPGPLLLLAAARGAWAQSPSCAAADFRRACLPCHGGGGSGDCTVLKTVQLDAEQNVSALAAQCCAHAARVPKCSVWTLNERNGKCNIKTQSIDYPKWNDTDDSCTSGIGPGPLPGPGPAPSPAPAPCPARPPPPPIANPSRNLLYIVVGETTPAWSRSLPPTPPSDCLPRQTTCATSSASPTAARGSSPRGWTPWRGRGWSSTRPTSSKASAALPVTRF